MLRDSYKESVAYEYISHFHDGEINIAPYEHLFDVIGDYSDATISELYPGKEEQYKEELERRFAAMLRYIIMVESNENLQWKSHKPLYVQMLQESLECNDGFLAPENIISVLCRANSNERWDLFAYYIVQNYDMTPEAFGRGLKSAWDSGVYDEAQIATQLFMMAVPDCLMDEKEMEMYNNLPDEVEVFRGTSIFENDGDSAAGLSWTIDRGVAEFFAFRGKRHREEDGIVYGAEVPKFDIVAIIEERGEREVILSDEAIETVIIDGEQYVVTKTKTKYYDRYVEEIHKQIESIMNK